MDTPEHLQPVIVPQEPDPPLPASAVQHLDHAWIFSADHNAAYDVRAFSELWNLHTEHPDFVRFCDGGGAIIEYPVPSWFEPGVIAFLQQVIFQWEMAVYHPGLTRADRVHAANQTACAQARDIYAKVINSIKQQPRHINSGRGYLLTSAKRYRITVFQQMQRGVMPLAEDRTIPKDHHDAAAFGDAPNGPADARSIEQRLFSHPHLVARPLVAALLRLRIRTGVLSRTEEALELGVTVEAIKQAREYWSEHGDRLWAYAAETDL